MNNAISDPVSPTTVGQECCDVVPIDPCGTCGLPIPVQPVQQIIGDQCGCGPVMSSEQLHSGEVISDGLLPEGQLMEAPIERIDVPPAEVLGTPLGLGEPSFLKRFTNWLSSSDNA